MIGVPLVHDFVIGRNCHRYYCNIRRAPHGSSLFGSGRQPAGYHLHPITCIVYRTRQPLYRQESRPTHIPDGWIIRPRTGEYACVNNPAAPSVNLTVNRHNTFRASTQPAARTCRYRIRGRDSKSELYKRRGFQTCAACTFFATVSDHCPRLR